MFKKAIITAIFTVVSACSLYAGDEVSAPSTVPHQEVLRKCSSCEKGSAKRGSWKVQSKEQRSIAKEAKKIEKKAKKEFNKGAKKAKTEADKAAKKVKKEANKAAKKVKKETNKLLKKK